MHLDQYYTNPLLAVKLYEIVQKQYPIDDYLIVEPSAGTGSFYSLFPEGSIGYDLDPRCNGIIAQDFLTVNLTSPKPIAMIGNPPFGKNASMALKFFNHAATMAGIIAFVLPRTFRKTSIQNKLSLDFHLCHDEIVPENSFIYEGEEYDVPCVFQIWEKRAPQRTKIAVETSHPDFRFTTPDGADFALQRVGVNAGRIKTDLGVSEQSHYFIQGNIATFRALDFNGVKFNTAGNPSIAKSEIVALYRAYTEYKSDK